MTFLDQQRLDVCRGCRNYRAALLHGACVLIRDPDERVSCEQFAKAIERGTWPQSTEDEIPCCQPQQEFNQMTR